MEQVIRVEDTGGAEAFEDFETLFDTLAHCNRDCAIQSYGRRRLYASKFAIEGGDLFPIGVGRRRRFGMERRDCCLYLIGSNRVLPKCGLNQAAAFGNLSVIPQTSVLQI